MTVIIREARLSDLGDIMRVEHSSFGVDAWSAEAIAADIERPTTSYFVVDEDGTVRGYAGVLAFSGGEADVLTIAVDGELRGRGIGRRLLRALIDVAETMASRLMFLEVREDNAAAMALYLSEGFELIGRRPAYYNDGTTALTMRRVLAARGVGPVGAEVLVPNSVAGDRGDAVTVTPDSGDVAGAGADANADADGSRFAATVKRQPLVLGIESSCDETGIGIVRGATLLANVIASSMDEHARYGGVVPEVAARAHLEALTPALQQAVADAGISIDEVDAVAVTAGPGLAGALMVGVGAAKALAVAIDKPLYGVNHLVGHVGADILDRGAVTVPTVALLVSGGHTSLLMVRDLIDDVELLGETIDDAAGEAFDKVARLLGLPYPGGPHIQRVASDGDPTFIRFPRGLALPKDMAAHRYDFSFSGVKTAVARSVERIQDAGDTVPVADIAASFQAAVVDVLISKAVAACRDHDTPRLLLGGGVVANAALRAEAQRQCADHSIELRIPPLNLCTDNGAMIAALGAQLILAGKAPSGLGFAADSTLPATQAMV